jgi:hypothetical protein
MFFGRIPLGRVVQAASSIALNGNQRPQDATRITTLKSYSTGFLAIVNDDVIRRFSAHIDEKSAICASQIMSFLKSVDHEGKVLTK